MSYGPPPGYPQQPYGPPPGSYGPPSPYGPYGGPNNALAYVTGGVFLIGAALALLVAITGWSGSSDNPDLAVALVGMAFSDDLTGNVDFAVSASMTVACTTFCFALVQLTRVDFARWVLAFLGAIVTIYYLYAIIWLLSNDGAKFIAMVLVSWVVWLAGTVLALLPQTGRAMRGYQRRMVRGGYPPRPPGYPPQPGYYG